jgi:hypothetical protein
MADTMQELGKTGLVEWFGVIQEDFLRDLRGRKGYTKFDEMRRNSPVVFALLNAIEQSIRSVDWEFTSEEGDEDPRLEILRDSIDNMTFSLNDHITSALTMLPFGFSIFEIVYRREGSRILWRKFGFRGQDTVYRWLFDDEGGIEGFVQRTSKGEEVTIPIEKLLLYRTKVEKNNPEGWSILRSGYVPYYYAKNISAIEAIGIERDMNGLPVITLPEGANPDEDDSNSDASKAAKVVRNIRADEQAGLVIPFGWEFTLASTQSNRLWDTSAIISRHEKRILMSALAQFLVLGMDQIGALSLSEDQTDFFNMSVNTTADIISDTFTKFAIPRLMALNGFDAEGLKLEHSPAGDVNIETLTKSLQAVAPNITWTAEDEVWLRSIFRLPEKSVEEIEELRQERKEEMEQLRQPMVQNEDEESDDMTAVHYAAGTAPDDDQRRKQEGRLRRIMKRYWTDQKKRIVKGSKSVLPN